MRSYVLIHGANLSLYNICVRMHASVRDRIVKVNVCLKVWCLYLTFFASLLSHLEFHLHFDYKIIFVVYLLLYEGNGMDEDELN